MSMPSEQLLDRLRERGALLPIAPGLYQQGAEFHRVCERVAATLRSLWADTIDIAVTVPSILPVDTAVLTGYVAAFPHLLLVGKSFDTENNNAYPALVNSAVNVNGHIDEWSQLFDQTHYVATPSACHGIYPIVPRPLPHDGFRAEAQAACVRNERTTEPGRFQWFHMLELVQIGPDPGVRSFMTEFTRTTSALLDRLGLAHKTVPATDPFFLGDRLAELVESSDTRKLEFVVDLIPHEPSPIAVGSVNEHGQHFTRPFSIANDNTPSTSACIGFGLERIALCLYGHHGIDTNEWSCEIRAILGLDSTLDRS